jgi:hypothetical protein
MVAPLAIECDMTIGADAAVAETKATQFTDAALVLGAPGGMVLNE